MGQDQVSGGVNVLCWLAAPVANCTKLDKLSYYFSVKRSRGKHL